MFYKVFFWVITVMLILSFFSVDNSDKNAFIRSDMSLKTDYLTGCQYLTTFWGGITPRLDKDGKQVCIEVNNETQNI